MGSFASHQQRFSGYLWCVTERKLCFLLSFPCVFFFFFFVVQCNCIHTHICHSVPARICTTLQSPHSTTNAFVLSICLSRKRGLECLATCTNGCRIHSNVFTFVFNRIKCGKIHMQTHANPNTQSVPSLTEMLVFVTFPKLPTPDS